MPTARRGWPPWRVPRLTKKRANVGDIRPGDGERQAAYGNHHRAAATLQKAAGNQQVNVVRNSTEKGTQGEKADGGREDVARAETVGHPSADGNKHSKAKRVAGEHRLHTERSHVQGFGDSRDSRVENRGIERLHEEGNSHEPREQLFGGVGS